MRKVQQAIATLAVHFIFFSGCVFAYPQMKTQPEIEVQIQPTKSTFRKGEPIQIRVELMNRSHRDLFVGRELGGLDSDPAHVRFYVWNSAGEQSPSGKAVGDRFTPSPESLLRAVIKRWIALRPQSSYSVTLYLDNSSFSFLKQPGHYRIRATYRSQGIKAQVTAERLVNAKREDLASLPFPAWEGEVNSNSVWINVLPPAKAQENSE